MPTHKQDSQRARQLLRLVQAQVSPEAQPDLTRAMGDLVAVLDSPLFSAIVDSQDAYNDAIGRELSAHTPAAARSDEAYRSLITKATGRNSASLSKSKLDEDLEWDDDLTTKDKDEDVEGNTLDDTTAGGFGEHSSTSSTHASRSSSHALPSASENITRASATSSNTAPDPYQPEEVEIPRGTKGLGFSIHGGVDKMHVPSNPAIFITSVLPTGAAAQDGRLREGDQILSVNGISFASVTHADAVQALKMPTTTVRLVVVHGVLQREIQQKMQDAEIALVEEYALNKGREGLGFSIAGGVEDPHISGDDSIFITKILPDSPAHQDGRLQIGDKLLAVNGQSCEGVPHEFAVTLLKSAQGVVSIKVEKNAYQRLLQANAVALGFLQAPKPRFSRTGTLKGDRLREALKARQAMRDRQSDAPGPVRTVELKGSSSGYGFNIVGPARAGSDTNDPTGIFISRVLPGGPADTSGQLQEGDQIMAVNGHSIEFASHNQAVNRLRRADRNSMTLLVRENPAVYAVFKEKMALLRQQLTEDRQTAHPPSGFYIRSLFDYDPLDDPTLDAVEKQKHILRIRLLDVFAVTSTVGDWWDVRNVKTGEEGVVPSRRRREATERRRRAGQQPQPELQEDVDTSPVKDGKSKRSKSFRLAKRFSLRRKKKTSQPQPDAQSTGTDTDSVDMSAIPTYERVVLRQQEDDKVRPLILLGPSKDVITDRLISDFPDLFGSCVPHTTRPPRPGEIEGEDYYFVTYENMEQDMQAGLFVEAGKYNGNLYGTSVKAVRDIAAEGRTCVLDVSAHSIHRLKMAGIHPITIFLRPASVHVVQEQNPGYDSAMCQNLMDLAVQADNEFKHEFTQIINNETFAKTYQQVVETIHRESKNPFWAATCESLP
eukprot:m.98347 g.98347  ORF g.98347 m.98347 type:complete len:886 (+) comp18564_c0_seq2:137-2794(+)